MQTKSSITVIISVVICIFFAIFAFSSFSSLRKMELEFNQKKATLVKENLDLKDRIDAVQDILNKKTESLDIMEKEKEEFESKLEILKKENEKLLESSAEQLEALKKKNSTLKKKISELENSPLIQRIKEAVDKEENENVKKFLEDALNKLTLIKEGKSVNLEPIVVTKKEAGTQTEAQGAATPTSASQEKRGIVLSLEKKNNLIIINLGRKDNLKEGDRLKVLNKDGGEMARAEVISVRYRIAAALIDDIQYKYKINDIREGSNVLVVEE